MENIGKAMVFKGIKSPFNLEEFKFPLLKPGEVLVRNSYSTVCTSDLHTFYGRRHSCTNSVLGHEVIGEIVDLSQGGISDYQGNSLKVGDKVTWTVFAFDPLSENTLKGFPQKSERLYKYGHEEINEEYQLNGGFSTHTHLRKGTAIFKLPSNLSLKEAAPINCSHATIAGAIRMAGDISDKNVLVSGVGMLGLSACAQAKFLGANQVWAQDINSEKLNSSEEFGADQTFLYPEKEIETANQEIGGIDIVIETSGSPEAIEKCIGLLGIGGTIILVGSVFPQRDLAINGEVLVRKILTIKGLHNYTPEDLQTAIEFVSTAKNRFPFEKLVGAEFPLDELEKAFELGQEGKHFRVGVKP
ncbi:zinc-binding dehydrogenase [Algoriphagus sp. PAP.12]|uniref:zinc-binding dehydrogenase n=1 Tax=Algoriphagus sp. PAP.12 TaxID=2996678 RepID=UPI00227C6C5F|nr:zinc-binding dehydrogenase [Algoriphagus sp. PAP.12]